MTYGLWYPRNQSLQLTAYSDADWANCVDERKSTSGGAFFLGNSLVAWLSKKQGSISLSTTEAEYIVVATCCTTVKLPVTIDGFYQRMRRDFGVISRGAEESHGICQWNEDDS
jgi:hypothetical protein